MKLEKKKILKKSLELFLLKIEKKYNDLVSITNDISIIILKDEIVGKQKKVKKIQLLDVFEKHNFEFAKKVLSGERSSASLQKYKRSEELIKNFIKKTYGLNNIEVEKINSSFIYNLETYLKFESEFKGIIDIENIYII